MSGATGKKPLNNPVEKMAFAEPAAKPPTPGEKAAALIAARRVTEINVARLGDLQEDQSALYRTAVTKLAKYIGANKPFFAQMEEDVSQLADAEGQMIFKAAVKQATAHVSVQLTPWTKVATKRSLLHDRTNVLPLIKTAADALQLHNAYALLATRETEEFAKLAYTRPKPPEDPADTGERDDAAPAADWTQTEQSPAASIGGRVETMQQKAQRTRQQNSRQPERDAPTPRGSAKKDTASQIIDAINDFIPKGSVGKTVGSMPGILDKMKATGDSKYAPKFRQKGIDHAVRDVSFVSNLQRLIMTDPILGEADPQHLVDLANDLQKGDPRIAHNPNQLRFALREALQYGGVPIQTHKTLADIDKSHSQAEETRAKTEDARYA